MASEHFKAALSKALDRVHDDARILRYYNDPVAWAEERAGLILWSKQKEILNSIAKNKRTAVKSCHSIGKDLPLDTPIPTPTGWTTMGGVQVGDSVLDPQGSPTTVVYKAPVQHNKNYLITFSDGSTQVAGAQHQWQTLDFKARGRIKNRKNSSPDWRDHWNETKTLTTEELYATVRTEWGQLNHIIPNSQPLDLPEQELPIHPYVLGAWLGDGTSSANMITLGEQKQHIVAKFDTYGYPLRKTTDTYGWTFTNGRNGSRSLWRELKLLNNKHIPSVYLRASYNQRLELLKGLMDTDGFESLKGVGIDLANERLANDVAELIRTFGIYVNVKKGTSRIPGVDKVYPRWRLYFVPFFNVFSKESHKRVQTDKQTNATIRRCSARTIKSVEPIDTVPTTCITVDNDMSMYLCGATFIPTHNTFTSAVVAAWWVDTRFNCMVQSTAPTYQQVHGQLWEEIRKLHHKLGLPGTVNEADQWKRPIQSDNTGRAKNILVGQGSKPADSNQHSFHGIHRPDGVLVLLDEGCGLPETLFTGAEAITTAGFDRQLTTGNPDDPATEFGKIFQEQGHLWNLITVSAFDTPNFTNEAQELRDKYKNDPDKAAYIERMLAGLPQPDAIEQQREKWGEESPRYLSKVLGEFPLVSEDSLYTPAEIAIGMSNNIKPNDPPFKVLGVDPARYGNDKAALVLNTDGKIEVVATYQTMDLMQLAAVTHKHAIDLGVDQVRVDAVGVGGGVMDRLIQLNRGSGESYVVIEMVASAAAPDRTLHRNARAYWYDSFKHKLRSGNIDLPDHQELLNELSRVRYEYPNGVMKIESKEDMRKRGVHSPDILDAAVMAVAPIMDTDNPLAGARPGQQVIVDLMPNITPVSPC